MSVCASHLRCMTNSTADSHERPRRCGHRIYRFRYVVVLLVCNEADRWEYRKRGQRRPSGRTSGSYCSPYASPPQHSVCMSR